MKKGLFKVLVAIAVILWLFAIYCMWDEPLTAGLMVLFPVLLAVGLTSWAAAIALVLEVAIGYWAFAETGNWLNLALYSAICVFIDMVLMRYGLGGSWLIFRK